METATKKRPGNPAFAKRESSDAIDVNKVYEFELIKTYEKYKPVDAESGVKVDCLYPPVFGLPNKGVAYDEASKKQRAWRFINSEPSIWVYEQRELETNEERDLLNDSDNQIEFKKGKLLVRGIEANKIKVLMVQDMFEGKKIQLKPSPREYRLINHDEVIENTLKDLDLRYESEKAARECTIEDMYAFAFVLGIDLNQTDSGIRKDFIVQSKANPDFFLKNIVNPKNKYLYAFNNAIADATWNINRENGNVTWTESKAYITKVNPIADVADELAKKAILNDEYVLKAYHQLIKL